MSKSKARKQRKANRDRAKSAKGRDRSVGRGGRPRKGAGRGRGSGTTDVTTARLMVNPGGFGFAERLDGEGSIFIPPGNFAGAMDGDEVVVSHWPAARGPEGHVRSVIVRKRTRITGILRRFGKHLAVEPDDPRILARAECIEGASPSAEGQVVVGTIVDYPDPWNENFTVKIDRVIGEPGTLDTEEQKILIEHGIRTEFPQPVLEETQTVPDRLRKPDRENRVDLRDLDFMTIDPHDARDFDDAVCVEVLGKDEDKAAMRIHVAVADVSHYVAEHTAVDEEAAVRCFSTYLPDRAIPMLPEVLSSGICSLVPRKDRLAMVVSLEVTKEGKTGEAEVRAAVIKSRMRLDYDQVAAELSGRKRLPPAVRQRILVLRKAADRLRKRRLRRGAIELNLPETKVVLDEDDPHRIRNIYSARASKWVTRAYNLIEEFMLAANEGVARLAVKHKLPLIYRVHESPDEERLERFAGAAQMLGAPVDPEQLVSPRGVQKYLKKVANHERSTSLSGLLLRAMAQAEYETVNIGHFALASNAYLHFTSPIRRYPDLINHRVMKAYLASRGEPAGPEPVPAIPRLKESQEHASDGSDRERASTQAERDARALFAAAYMRDRIGDRFEGRITGLSETGVFVTLDDPFVDGMIRRLSIEKDSHESYRLDELGIRLVAAKSGHTLAVGDGVVVDVLDASLQRRQIDLALVAKLS